MNETDSRMDFAIAMPVGAWHPLLPRALRSVAIQEVPVQAALLDASDDPRVRDAADASGIDFAFRRHGPDGGQSAAIATGWRETDAAIVGWLNADDLLTPGALALAAQAFAADPELGVVYGGSEFIDAEGNVTGRHDQVADVSDYLLRSNTISQPSCFVRRDLMEAVGGVDETLVYTMDWDLWVRLYRHGARFQRTDAVLSQVFMGDGTKTAAWNASRYREIAALVRRNAGSWNAVKSTVSAALFTLAEARRG